VYDLTELAGMVQSAGIDFGLKVEIANYDNPRKEAEDHYYNPDHVKLLELGYQPTRDIQAEIKFMIKVLMLYRDRIEHVKGVLIPKIKWDGSHKESALLEK